MVNIIQFTACLAVQQNEIPIDTFVFAILAILFSVSNRFSQLYTSNTHKKFASLLVLSVCMQ